MGFLTCLQMNLELRKYEANISHLKNDPLLLGRLIHSFLLFRTCDISFLVYFTVYLQWQAMVDVASAVGADAVSHGCTGKGNDQVRFLVVHSCFEKLS